MYVHIPFCRHRCAYCDFNTYAGKEGRIEAYTDALCLEIRSLARGAHARLPVHTIFFGGGTPSLVPPAGLSRVIETLAQSFDLSHQAEISLEANPGTLSLPYLENLRRIGFNRLSLGMQSAHPDDLRLLERQHDYVDVVQAVKWARQAGFSNLNLDLIFGIPGQSLERWRRTLDLALALRPEHLSLYALTLEHGTPFERWSAHGLVPQADPDLAADMYETAEERLAREGYLHYEISNWAKVIDGLARVCAHNLQYWHNWPYLGFGAGAHGYAGGYRTANVLGIEAYIRRCHSGDERAFPFSPATVNALPIDRFTEMQETMMVGLRLTEEGVSTHEFRSRFGKDIREVFGKDVEDLLNLGLLEWSGDDHSRLRLTTRGRLLGNQVFMRFVGEGVSS